MMNRNTRSSLYDAFLTLSAIDYDNSTFVVTNVEGLEHRIGRSYDGSPMFFVNCADDEKISDIKLDILSVLFNRQCKITDTETLSTYSGLFSIIQLNSDNKELVKYFLEVIGLVLNRLGVTPSVEDLRKELIKVIRLFSNPPKFNKDVIRGLWAELLVIDQSKDPGYLINSWHVVPEDKFDFNDGENKIEIKSTSRLERIHAFSLEQLCPNPGSKLLIGSVFVVQSGMGKSVFDIENSIQTRLINTSQILKLREIILSTIGANIVTVENMYFDYTMGSQSLTFFDYAQVPSIPKGLVPCEVSNVHFSSDLSNIESYVVSNSDCDLFKSL